jgi:hypothetical protein
MYILQQIEWINFRTVEDTRSQTLYLFIVHNFDRSKYIFVAKEYTANVIYCSPQLFIFIEPINTRFLHVFM